MKPRPRSVERKVAEHLSATFRFLGYSSVQRVPVLGRTGPDITINEFGLVIDVKSRLCISKALVANIPIVIGEEFIGAPLERLVDLTETTFIDTRRHSIVIKRWFDHMVEWQLENCPNGIPALILHRPGMPVGKSVFVIYEKDRKEFAKRWKLKLSTSQ